MPLPYRHCLKKSARDLRTSMTDSEQLLWFYIRRKQVFGIQFYRQRPIGNYIVDFYAPTIGLVIEVDGGQHFEQAGLEYDARRTVYLEKLGLEVARYGNMQVLKETSFVLEEIYRIIDDRKSPSIPL